MTRTDPATLSWPGRLAFTREVLNPESIQDYFPGKIERAKPPRAAHLRTQGTAAVQLLDTIGERVQVRAR